MKFKNEEAKEKWNRFVDNNKNDPYGESVMVFSKAWAERMETKILEYPTLEFGIIADQTDGAANKKAGGITGFQYGCAVSLLSDVWVYGETLRRWHNLKTQIGTEGIEANNKGGVLNPALITINTRINGNDSIAKE